MRKDAPAFWQLAGPRHGPLPLFLLALTLVTGLVDAVSVLRLGRVFVANMTGNVVFVGFAIAGAPGFSLIASLVALAGFLVGASGGGGLVARFGGDRARLLQITAAIELVLMAAATVGAALWLPSSTFAIYVVAALLSPAMGVQNAAARRLAVPDATTTVLTMTLTGIAADLRSHQPPRAVARRLVAVVTMLVGAIVGALLVLHVAAWLPLGIAALLAAVVVAGIEITARSGEAWREPAGAS
ncbi:MAG: YoaK family protein [Candidatus Dormiibacterota bacterium]